jgi:hypothetical protein
MTTSSQSARQSIAIISENDPVKICPRVEVVPNGLIVTLGDLNMYMSVQSGMNLADMIVEGCMIESGIEYDEEFHQ